MREDKGFMNTVPVVTGDRAQLAAIAADSQRLGIKDIVPMRGFLRAEVLMGSGSNSIQFPIRQDDTSNGQPVGSTERRLITNDAFYATAHALMFYTAAASTAGLPSTQAARARARLQQFPNSSVFGLNAPELQAAFNGTMTITQNNKIFMRQADINTMQLVDLAQQGVAGALASSQEFPKGFLRTDAPMIRYNGQSDIVVLANFPDTVSPTEVAGQSVYAVYYALGWYVQNGGVARTAQD